MKRPFPPVVYQFTLRACDNYTGSLWQIHNGCHYQLLGPSESGKLFLYYHHYGYTLQGRKQITVLFLVI
jgi:hypothetical protein